MIHYTTILIILFSISGLLSAQENRFPIEMENGQTFYPGAYTLDDEEHQRGYIHFDRKKQLLLIMSESDILAYNASDVDEFHYTFQSGTPYAEEIRYITWRFRSDWPSYEHMTFFQVLGDYTNCAIVSADRKPKVVDLYPDSTELFYARVSQGKSFHIILPDGSVVPYDRETVDENLQKILKDDYAEVMLYAHNHGLQATRFIDLFAILDYAENLRLP